MNRADKRTLVAAARLLEEWARIEWDSNVDFVTKRIEDRAALASYNANKRAAAKLRTIAAKE